MADVVAHGRQVAIEPIAWSALNNVYAIANGKGGVGKTTTTSHLGGLAASDGVRVCLVDLNQQGNLSLDLGVKGDPSIHDEGANLAQAIMFNAPLQPVSGIRPNLDLVPGGLHLRDVPPALSNRMSTERSRRAAVESLARALTTVAPRYDLIIIDTPPENPPLLRLGLCAARWVLVPMVTDSASRDGLRSLAEDFVDVRDEYNPYLNLLGAFIFASATAGKRIRAEMREQARADLGDSAHVFEQFIRHSAAVGFQIRKYGLLAHELEEEVARNPKFWELRSGKAQRTETVSATAVGVAEDFANLAREVFARAAEVRRALIEEGNWPNA